MFSSSPSGSHRLGVGWGSKTLRNTVTFRPLNPVCRQLLIQHRSQFPFPLQPSLQKGLFHKCTKFVGPSPITSKENLRERPFSISFLAYIFVFQWRNCAGHWKCKLCQWHCCSAVHLKPSFAFKFKMRGFPLPAHSCQMLLEPSEAQHVSLAGRGEFPLFKASNRSPHHSLSLVTVYSLSENWRKCEIWLVWPLCIYSVALLVNCTCLNLPFLAEAWIRS